MRLDHRLAVLESKTGAPTEPVMGDTEARRHLEFFAYLGGRGPSEPLGVALARLAGVTDALAALRSDPDGFAARVNAVLAELRGLEGDERRAAVERIRARHLAG